MSRWVPKQTAWANSSEWLRVHDLLMMSDDPVDHQRGCDIVSAWKARGVRLPLGVEVVLNTLF